MKYNQAAGSGGLPAPAGLSPRTSRNIMTGSADQLNADNKSPRRPFTRLPPRPSSGVAGAVGGARRQILAAGDRERQISTLPYRRGDRDRGARSRHNSWHNLTQVGSWQERRRGPTTDILLVVLAGCRGAQPTPVVSLVLGTRVAPSPGQVHTAAGDRGKVLQETVGQYGGTGET